MKQNNQNKRLFFLAIMLTLFFLKQGVTAQDSLFQMRFQQNISQLNELYCWTDSDFLPGEFEWNTNINFAEESRKNVLFSDLQLNVKVYYKYFDGMQLANKQNLIRYFSYHEPFFQAQLKEASLSPELKYLAPAISAMNPLSVDEKKHAGIWQLTHFQGVLNGLHVNRLSDERFNEELATQAFVKQIQQYKSVFNSEELALLAYLGGHVKLKNTLARCGYQATVAELLKHFPSEVSETIAAFRAMAVFLQVNKFIQTEDNEAPDYVKINREMHFQQVADVVNIPVKQLRFLNPQYHYSIVPASKNGLYLAIPSGKHDEFILGIDSIYSAYDSTLFQVVAQKIEYAPAPNRQYVGEKVKDLEIEGKTKIKYTIQSGDVLGFIAEDYDVRVADLKYWNNIYNERKIQAGKTLDIFVDDNNADYYKGLQKQSTSKSANAKTKIIIPENARKVEHTVKNGESPYVIAKKYNGVSPEAILEWNGISDARKIQIGQKLIIYIANK